MIAVDVMKMAAPRFGASTLFETTGSALAIVYALLIASNTGYELRSFGRAMFRQCCSRVGR